MPEKSLVEPKSLAESLDDFYSQQAATPPAPVIGNRPWSRPIKSVACAVHPDQIAEAQAEDQRLGVPTEYTSDGRPVFTDRAHRKKFLRAHQLYDRDAGYGDAGPLHHKGEKAPPSRLAALAQRLGSKIRVRHNT